MRGGEHRFFYSAILSLIPGFSQIFSPDGLKNTLVSQGCVLGTPPTVGTMDRRTFQDGSMWSASKCIRLASKSISSHTFSVTSWISRLQPQGPYGRSLTWTSLKCGHQGIFTRWLRVLRYYVPVNKAKAEQPFGSRTGSFSLCYISKSSLKST